MCLLSSVYMSLRSNNDLLCNMIMLTGRQSSVCVNPVVLVPYDLDRETKNVSTE